MRDKKNLYIIYMDFFVESYEFKDIETPGPEFTRFSHKVELLKQKEEKTNNKPEKVYENFKKPPRRSKRINKKKVVE